MKVFKFGGASVKNAEAVKNVAVILNSFQAQQIVVVVSAMGKTTNALEKLTNAYYNKENNTATLFEEIKKFHRDILSSLFPSEKHPVYDEVNNLFVETEWLLEEVPARNYDFIYDQIVSIGEFLSSRIVSAYLQESGVANKWLDVRDCIHTDDTYREAKVNWELTTQCSKNSVSTLFSDKTKVAVTQGFVGVTSENYTTTLGREGSDYSAAILAYTLDAEDVTIWKDVPGVLNADPKWFDNTEKLKHLSYQDAIELSYYGATVIHPKTIQPLLNKNIPLHVKSFISPKDEGTLISKEIQTAPLIPSFIFKIEQVLLSISSKDFSFIVEENLSDIFGMFAKHKVKMNLMQNSAISFSVCFDYDKFKVPSLIDDLMKNFKVLYNDHLELVTIRHYDQPTIDRVTTGKYIFVEQRSRTTVQIVMKNEFVKK